jgi:hypothetical protein
MRWKDTSNRYANVARRTPPFRVGLFRHSVPHIECVSATCLDFTDPRHESAAGGVNSMSVEKDRCL